MEKRSYLILTVIMTVSVCVGFMRADLNDGLVAYWTFDEGSGTIAYDSVGGHNGTLMNGPVWTEGIIGGALDFDGANDYISCGDILDNEINNAFTIGVWVKLREGALQKTHNYILWKSDDRPGLYIVSNGEVVFAHWYEPPAHSFHSTHVLQEQKWYYISYVFDGSRFTGYINAEYTGSIADNGYSPGGSVSIAADNTHYRRFDGIMDDIRIYNRALSFDEIEALYLEGARELTGLEIVGPTDAAESSATQYKAIAHYDNGSMNDVTSLADWSVGPNDDASISAGLLTTEAIDLPTDVTITAEYSEGDNIQIAQKDVSILAICPSTSALKFDGVDDYVEIDGYKGIAGTTSRTCSAWIKIDKNFLDRASIMRWGQIVNIEEGRKWHFRVGNFWNDPLKSKLELGVGVGAIRGSTPLNDCNWHHVAVVLIDDGSPNLSEIQLYVDGKQESTTLYNYIGSPPDIDTEIAENILIGTQFANDGVTSNFYLDGILDDVRIYNKAFLAEEIQTLMYTRPDTSDPSLVGYWNFDEGVGPVAFDSSIYGNDGELKVSGYCDPNDPECRGPIWIEPGAPGICTLEGIVERNLSDIWNVKVSILEQLYEAMIQEAALVEYMNEKFADRDFGDTSKNDVVKAKQKIHAAIQNEADAGDLINESLDKLDDAMNTLGIELEFDNEPVE